MVKYVSRLSVLLYWCLRLSLLTALVVCSGPIYNFAERYPLKQILKNSLRLTNALLPSISSASYLILADVSLESESCLIRPSPKTLICVVGCLINLSDCLVRFSALHLCPVCPLEPLSSFIRRILWLDPAKLAGKVSFLLLWLICDT